MNYSSMTSLALRVTGVIILVNVFSGVPKGILELIRLSEQANNSTYTPAMLIALSAASIALPGVLGLLFVIFPTKISEIIVDRKENETQTANHETLQLIILSALGAYFTATALFDSVYILAKLRLYFSFIENSEVMRNAPKLLPEDFASIVSTLCQLLIGLFLLLGSKGLSRGIIMLRGTPITSVEIER